MNELTYVYFTAALIIGNLLLHIVRRKFDPFDPIWMFSVGFFQLYVVQAISYHDYAITARGEEITSEANFRAFWAMAWFMLVYYFGIGRWFSRKLPSAPNAWSKPLTMMIAPLLFAWGLLCARMTPEVDLGQVEPSLLLNFPILMLVAGVLLIITSRSQNSDKPEGEPIQTHWPLMLAGLSVTLFYAMIWMFNGKRSHSLFGVLVTLAAFYLSQRKRPPLAVLACTAVVGVLTVAVAIGWRNNPNYTRDVSGFVQFVQDFDPQSVLISLNLKDREENAIDPAKLSKETEEYGGFLLMMATVPILSEYDYGESYLRIFSTYIPRIVWPDKPLFGREKWLSAWQLGSEFKRDATFTGPAIGILGATQLNGGVIGTLIVLGVLATGLRTAYDYFRLYAHSPWAQAWWALTFYNAWLMTVNDDPMVWQYYIYGHTILPLSVFFWVFNKVNS